MGPHYFCQFYHYNSLTSICVLFHSIDEHYTAKNVEKS